MGKSGRNKPSEFLEALLSSRVHKRKRLVGSAKNVRFVWRHHAISYLQFALY